MGASNSKFKASGTLQSASSPPIISVLPPPLEGPKEFEVRVPPGKKSGDSIGVEHKGKAYIVKIPKRTNGKPHVGGDCFKFRDAGDVNRVVASTQSSIPGFQVVEQKPIVWSTVGMSTMGLSRIEETTDIGNMTGPLLQEAQAGLIE